MSSGVYFYKLVTKTIFFVCEKFPTGGCGLKSSGLESSSISADDGDALLMIGRVCCFD